MGLRLLAVEVSRSHSDTLHAVGFFRTSDHPDAEASNWQITALARGRHPCFRRNSNPQSQQTSGHRPTPENARPPGSALWYN